MGASRDFGCLVGHPGDTNVIIYGVGSYVVISDLSDPHDQKLLKGHTARVNNVVFSPSGELFATGQIADARRDSRIIIWDYETLQPLFTLYPHKNGVGGLRFSPDDEFLATYGLEDNVIFIFDVETGTVVTSLKQNKATGYVAWMPIIPGPRPGSRPTYCFSTADATQVNFHTMNFDRGSLTYILKSEKAILPCSGLSRQYTCGTTIGGEFLLLGTGSGELVVFAIRTRVYKACTKFFGGLTTCMIVHGQNVYMSCVNGTVVRVTGTEMTWRQEASTRFEGSCTSLSFCDSTPPQLLAVTGLGNVFSVHPLNVEPMDIIASNELGPVIAVAFDPEDSENFFTLNGRGRLCKWCLSDYILVHDIVCSQHEGKSMHYCKDKVLYVGFSDGTILGFDCSDGPPQRILMIPNAHNGPVTALAANDLCIASGGGDGIVRIWSKNSGQFVSQITEHGSPVTSILLDNVVNSLVHSSASNGTIHVTDMKNLRRVKFRIRKTSSALDMVQFDGYEHEVITADSDGRLTFWDFDMNDPVKIIESPPEKNLGMIEKAAEVLFNPDAETRKSAMPVIVSDGPMHFSWSAIALKRVIIPETGEEKYFMVAVGNDPVVYLYDLTRDQERLIGTQSCHATKVNDIQWTPDGKQIVSVGEDGEICIWNFFVDDIDDEEVD